jgi:hypothetical protein
MSVLAIIQLATGISTILPLALADAVKIKALLAPLGPDIKVNIVNLEGVAISEDTATMSEVNSWLASKGLPPLAPEPPSTS